MRWSARRTQPLEPQHRRASPLTSFTSKPSNDTGRFHFLQGFFVIQFDVAALFLALLALVIACETFMMYWPCGGVCFSFHLSCKNIISPYSNCIVFPIFLILFNLPTTKAMDSAYCTDDTISDDGHLHPEQATVAVEAEDDFVIQDKSDDEDQPKQKKKRPRLVWAFIASFGQHEEEQANDYISKEFSSPGFPLAKDQPYTCHGQLVQTFKCSGKKRYGCHFKAKVVCKGHGNDKVFEVYTCGSHNHTRPDQDQKHGIPNHHKSMLDDGVKARLEPAELHRKLTLKSPQTAVTLQQVQTYAKTAKKHLYRGLADNTIGSLFTWCQEHELPDTAAPNQFGVLPGWSATGPDDLLSDAADVCFVLSTPNLLKNAIRQSSGHLVSFLDIDQTYKLCDNGYPVTVIGTVDANHKFSLVLLQI